MNCYTSILLHADMSLSETHTFFINIYNRLYNYIRPNLRMFYILLLKCHCEQKQEIISCTVIMTDHHIASHRATEL